MNDIYGIYTCCKCKKTFKKPIGPTYCSHCGSIYVHWDNYEELYEKHFKYQFENIKKHK